MFSIIYDIFSVLKMCVFSHSVYLHVKRLRMPSEAYPAVYWQYFAVHFIVQGREQMTVLKDSTLCPREVLPPFCGKGQPGQPRLGSRGMAGTTPRYLQQKREDALEKRLQGLLPMKR